MRTLWPGTGAIVALFRRALPLANLRFGNAEVPLRTRISTLLNSISRPSGRMSAHARMPGLTQAVRTEPERSWNERETGCHERISGIVIGKCRGNCQISCHALEGAGRPPSP